MLPFSVIEYLIYSKLMLDRPFLELGRVFLLQDLLHLLPQKSNFNCTLPLEDYLLGEPQNFNLGQSIQLEIIIDLYISFVPLSAMELFIEISNPR